MKKTIAALFALLSAAVFAGEGDVLITFSTPGPDKYADGADVLPGERYALVWTPTEGDQKIVLTYPGATKIDNADGMHCPPVLFVVDETTAKSYKNGTWGVYLLDTRNYTNGADGSSLSKDFDENAVNVKAPVAEGIVSTAKMESAATSGAVSAGSFNIPNPTVTGIKVEGAKVFITVEDIVPCLEYTLKSGSDVQAEFALPSGDVSSEMAASAKKITLAVDKQPGAQFFKVTTK